MIPEALRVPKLQFFNGWKELRAIRSNLAALRDLAMGAGDEKNPYQTESVSIRTYLEHFGTMVV